MKFSVGDFFSKCEQMHSFLCEFGSHLLNNFYTITEIHKYFIYTFHYSLNMFEYNGQKKKSSGIFIWCLMVLFMDQFWKYFEKRMFIKIHFKNMKYMKTFFLHGFKFICTIMEVLKRRRNNYEKQPCFGN